MKRVIQQTVTSAISKFYHVNLVANKLFSPLFADACQPIAHESFPQNHGGGTANKILLGSVDLSVCLSTYLFSLFFPLPPHSSVKQKNITTTDCSDVPNQGISWNSRETA